MPRKWGSAQALADEIGCSSSLIHLWHKQGDVERKSVPAKGRRWRGYRWTYNREQALERAKTLKRIRKVWVRYVDGVELYRCNVCVDWKVRDDFYKEPKNRKNGIQSRCKKCFSDYYKERYDTNSPRYVKARKKAVIEGRRSTANARIVSSWKYPHEIEAIIVKDAVRRAYAAHTARDLADICGVPDRQIRRVLEDAQDDRNVTLALAVKILDGLGLHKDIDAIYRFFDRGKPRWSKNHDYCQKCLRTTVRHIARGLCGTCYSHRHDPGYVPIPETRWSLAHAQCVECRSTRYKHQGYGKCTSCYRREWRAKQRQRVGSDHGIPRQLPQDGAAL